MALRSVNSAICIAVAMVVAVFYRSQAADVLLVPALGDVRLLGRVGERADSCIRVRAFSDWARGKMYDECVNAFRTHADDKTAGWQNEYWGKTMLCFAGAVAYTRDAELSRWTLGKAHAFISEFQKPNGYLCTYSDEDFVFGDGFNIWGRKYTLWALIELYHVTGDERCLDAAVKMGDHLVGQLKRLHTTLDKTGVWHGISSMSILRPLMELYRQTRRAQYVDLANEIVVAMRDPRRKEGALIANAFRHEAIWTWFPRPCYWAKAYEMMSCYEGLVDYYRLTGEKCALDAAMAFYEHLEREEMNPMGSVGYFDHFVNASGHVNGMSELCDVVHWIRLCRELLLVTGEAKYADRIEEAFYNAFLAGCQVDGRWGAHLIRSHGTRHLAAPAQTGMTEHQCCPDNMMRTFFDIASSSVLVDASGGVSIVLYSDSEVKTPDANVVISGGYPWGESAVCVTVTRAKAGKVRFRFPSWASWMSVNGKTYRSEKGWVTFDAHEGRNDYSVCFDLSPRFVDWTASETEDLPASPQDFSDEDIGKYTVHFFEWMAPEMTGMHRVSCAARVLRGPLVLAKGRLAGTSRRETLEAGSLRGCRVKLSLSPLQNEGGWILSLDAGATHREVPVLDFATASNPDDEDGWFSLWF